MSFDEQIVELTMLRTKMRAARKQARIAKTVSDIARDEARALERAFNAAWSDFSAHLTTTCGDDGSKYSRTIDSYDSLSSEEMVELANNPDCPAEITMVVARIAARHSESIENIPF